MNINFKNNKNIKTIIITLIEIIVIYFFTRLLISLGVINVGNNKGINDDNIETQEKEKSTNVKTKLVDDLICKDSEETFGDVTVKLKQELEDEVCSTVSITINDKDIRDDVAIWVNSYEIYDNNVFIMSMNTSGPLLTIYSLNDESVVMKLLPETLNDYWVESYTIEKNKIIIVGRECAEQCGNISTGHSKAKFKIKYSGNEFSKPEIIKKYKY